MGMDVSGLNPSSDEGGYFRASIWGWPTITTVMEASGYDVPETWYYNDGEGLDTQEECDELALRMEEYINVKSHTTMAPKVTDFGRVVFKAVTGEHVGREEVKPVDEGFVREFITFLRGCGGFEIW